MLPFHYCLFDVFKFILLVGFMETFSLVCLVDSWVVWSECRVSDWCCPCLWLCMFCKGKCGAVIRVCVDFDWGRIVSLFGRSSR